MKENILRISAFMLIVPLNNTHIKIHTIGGSNVGCGALPDYDRSQKTEITRYTNLKNNKVKEANAYISKSREIKNHKRS